MASKRDIDKRLYDKDGFLPDLTPYVKGALARRYTQPPYSILDTRKADWQERCRKWLALGIKSELGRDIALYTVPKRLSDGRVGSNFNIEASVFDPVLCELMYSWFCPPGGIVLDPFAGGSVRGIVASVCGLRYWGSELRGEQVASNRAQLNPQNTGQYAPKWWCQDSLAGPPPKLKADFILTCPPYGNLERYSDDPADISNMPWERFTKVYAAIMHKFFANLRENRFAAIVVSNYRDTAAGKFRNLVGATTTLATAAGLELYNDIVLINAFGTAGVRTNTTFEKGSRKIVKCHQNVLVFIKGCPKQATAAITKET